MLAKPIEKKVVGSGLVDLDTLERLHLELSAIHAVHKSTLCLEKLTDTKSVAIKTL